MIVAYIAAPYAGDEAANLRRADALALAVALLGRAVYIPHRAIGQQRPDTARSRAPAIRACLAAVDRVAKMGGELHVLERDDGSLSPGCALEVERWRAWGAVEVRWMWGDDGPVQRDPRP